MSNPDTVVMGESRGKASGSKVVAIVRSNNSASHAKFVNGSDSRDELMACCHVQQLQRNDSRILAACGMGKLAGHRIVNTEYRCKRIGIYEEVDRSVGCQFVGNTKAVDSLINAL